MSMLTTEDFFLQYNKLIEDLERIITNEKNYDRKLYLEGGIYDLYIHILKYVSVLDLKNLAQVLGEADKIERANLTEHYFYNQNSILSWDYRFEFPCRTSAVILDILKSCIDNTEVADSNDNASLILKNILQNRCFFLRHGYSNKHNSEINRLLDLLN